MEKEDKKSQTPYYTFLKSYVACHVSQVHCHVSHVTCQMLCVTYEMTSLTSFTRSFHLSPIKKKVTQRGKTHKQTNTKTCKQTFDTESPHHIVPKNMAYAMVSSPKKLS